MTTEAPPFKTHDASDGWLSCKQAAKVSRLGVRAWARRANCELKAAKVEGRPSLVKRDRPESGLGKRIWLVHKSLSYLLSPLHFPSESEARRGLSPRYPKYKIDAAISKYRWLREWWRLRAEARGKHIRSATLAAQVAALAKSEDSNFAIGRRSLEYWQRAYNRHGRDGSIKGVESLIDRRGYYGPPTELWRTPAAISYFYSLYHRDGCPTLRWCHRETLKESREQGWNWAATYAATLKWLCRYDESLESLRRPQC